MQSSFTCILSLALPPVVDIVVSRLGLVCPPYGIYIREEEEGGRQEKEQEENEEKKTKSVRKEENNSGVGIQANTTIIITRCNSCLLMKRESAGELPIRPKSSFIHSFSSTYTFHILLKNIVKRVFGWVRQYFT
jgi:hypothetical protein